MSLDQKDLQLSEKFAELVINAALDSQGESIYRQFLAEVNEATRRELASMKTAVIDLQTDVGQSFNGFTQTVNERLLDTEKNIQKTVRTVERLATDSRTDMRTDIATIRNSFSANFEQLRADSALQLQAIRAIEDSIAALGNAIVDLQQKVTKTERLAHSDAVLVPLSAPVTSPVPPTVQVTAGGSFLDRIASMPLVIGVALGVGFMALVLFLFHDPRSNGRPETVPPGPMASPAIAPSAPTPASKPPASAVSPQAQDPATSEDRYLTQLYDKLAEASTDSQQGTSLKKLFQDAEINWPSERPTFAQLEAKHAEGKLRRVPGAILQAMIRLERKPDGKADFKTVIDGKVGDNTQDSLEQLDCVKAWKSETDQKEFPTDWRPHWIAILKQCARR